MRCIQKRLKDKEHLFWEELMEACLRCTSSTFMILYARSQNTIRVSERITVLLRNFIELLYNGVNISKSDLDFLHPGFA